MKKFKVKPFRFNVQTLLKFVKKHKWGCTGGIALLILLTFLGMYLYKTTGGREGLTAPAPTSAQLKTATSNAAMASVAASKAAATAASLKANIPPKPNPTTTTSSAGEKAIFQVQLDKRNKALADVTAADTAAAAAKARADYAASALAKITAAAPAAAAPAAAAPIALTPAQAAAQYGTPTVSSTDPVVKAAKDKRYLDARNYAIANYNKAYPNPGTFAGSLPRDSLSPNVIYMLDALDMNRANNSNKLESLDYMKQITGPTFQGIYNALTPSEQKQFKDFKTQQHIVTPATLQALRLGQKVDKTQLTGPVNDFLSLLQGNQDRGEAPAQVNKSMTTTYKEVWDQMNPDEQETLTLYRNQLAGLG